MMLAQLTEGYLDMGRAEQGLNLVAETLAVARHTGQRWDEAELYRLKGGVAPGAVLGVSRGGRSLCSSCLRDAPPGGQVARIAGRGESGAAVAAPGSVQ
jgi:hypothetical protein